MKQAVQYALFGTVIAIAAGLIGAYGFSNTNSSTMSNPFHTSGMMIGHITLTAYDENGNIKAYRQTDNVIVDQGENCTLSKLFGNGTGTGSEYCSDVNTGFFQYIGVGNGTTVTSPFDFTALENAHDAPGLERDSRAETIVNTAANAGTATAKSVITKQFVSQSTNQQTISESGIFNATSANPSAMFARQVFTGIPLNTGESLTVEWTINIGGTGTLPSGTETT